jgi:hypothetical protein
MLLSELLLTKVDARLKTRRIIDGFRYADDYELVFNERAQAERGLAVLEDALTVFELELKTSEDNYKGVAPGTRQSRNTRTAQIRVSD